LVYDGKTIYLLNFVSSLTCVENLASCWFFTAGGTPRHRAGRGDSAGHASHATALPVHVCTMSPEAIRDEVETLKTDFNCRVTQILFDSMLCAYYMGCVPLCFAQVVASFMYCVIFTDM